MPSRLSFSMIASSSQRLVLPLGMCFASAALICGLALKLRCWVRPVARKLRPSTASAVFFCRDLRAAFRPSTLAENLARAAAMSRSSKAMSAIGNELLGRAHRQLAAGQLFRLLPDLVDLASEVLLHLEAHLSGRE